MFGIGVCKSFSQLALYFRKSRQKMMLFTSMPRVLIRGIVNDVGILGAPISKGQPKSGVENGPSAIRTAGLIKELKNIGLSVKDYGDVSFTDVEHDPPDGIIKNPRYVGNAVRKLSTAVYNVLQNENMCLTLGGDHSLGIGTIYGHTQANPDICVLWVDAHADLNTSLSSESGNLHGMSCSFVIHELQKFSKPVVGFEWLNPCLRKGNFAYIALRDVDPVERFFLDELGILNYSMDDIDKLGILHVVKSALQKINPNNNLSIHVSFDIDSIDKYITPSTGTPVPGGLLLREAICLAEEVSKTGMLKALDLVEVNPLLGRKDEVEKTLDCTLHVIKAFFGHKRSGNALENVELLFAK